LFEVAGELAVIVMKGVVATFSPSSDFRLSLYRYDCYPSHNSSGKNRIITMYVEVRKKMQKVCKSRKR
jgi:hypothetical protein